jgi:hypothetical protein
MRTATRIEVQTNPAWAPNGNCGIDGFKHESRPILDRPTIFIRPMITHILKELVQQVAIGAVQLDSIKTGGESVFRPSTVLFDNPGNFIEGERARRYERLFRANQADVSTRGDGTGSDRESTIQIDWI